MTFEKIKSKKNNFPPFATSANSLEKKKNHSSASRTLGKWRLSLGIIFDTKVSFNICTITNNEY